MACNKRLEPEAKSAPSSKRKKPSNNREAHLNHSSNEKPSQFPQTDSDTTEKPRKPVREFSAIYDTLESEGYPVDELAASIVRLLDFEGDEGIAQVINFVTRLAGCYVPASTTPSDNVDAANSAAENLDSQCAVNAPLKYPMLKKETLQKLQSLLSALLEYTIESGDIESQVALMRRITPLCESHTRALRHSASAFVCVYARALAIARRKLLAEAASGEVTNEALKTSTGMNGKLLRQSARRKATLGSVLTATLALSVELNTHLDKRLKDIAAPIRHLALLAAAEVNPDVRDESSCFSAIAVGLDDADNSVRLCAIRLLSQNTLDISPRVWTRIRAIILFDSHAKCRASAVRLVSPTAPKQVMSSISTALNDIELSVRVAAAETAVQLARVSFDDCQGEKQQWSLLCKLCSIISDIDEPISQLVGAALYHEMGVEFIHGAASLVLHDFTAENQSDWIEHLDRPGSNFTYTAIQLLAGTLEAAKSDVSTQTDRELLAGLAATQLGFLPQLVQRYGEDPELGPLAMRCCKSLSMLGAAWQGLDTEVYNLLELLVTILFNSCTAALLNAISSVFASWIDEDDGSLKPELLERLNSALLRAIVENTPLQCVALLRWGTENNLTAITKLPGLWDSEDELSVILVRTLGMRGPVALMPRCAEHLSKLGREEELTLVRIAAMLKGKELDYPPVQRSKLSVATANGAEAAGLKLV